MSPKATEKRGSFQILLFCVVAHPFSLERKSAFFYLFLLVATMVGSGSEKK